MIKQAYKTDEIPNRKHYAILVQGSVSNGEDGYGNYNFVNYLEYHYTFDKNEWEQEIVKRTTNKKHYEPKFLPIIVDVPKVTVNVEIKDV